MRSRRASRRLWLSRFRKFRPPCLRPSQASRSDLVTSMENPGIAAEKREEAAKTLREILDRMGIEAEVSAFDDGDRIILDAHGAESGLIIGKKGATLDALQYVINRIISKKPNDGPGVVVDAEGYRGRREDSLADLARRLADKAMKSGRPVPVEPMNPHDRRIVHVTLADHPGVRTESDGEGLFRRVVIYPKSRAEQGSPSEPR